MSGRLTLWGAGELLRSFFGKSSEPPPSFYLALVKETAPSAYVSGMELDEPDVAAGYQRFLIPNEVTSFNYDESSLNIVSNLNELAFITATADWGRIAYWAICNAEVDGYVYFVGQMENEQIINLGDQAVVDADELVIELGPFFTDEDF